MKFSKPLVEVDETVILPKSDNLMLIALGNDNTFGYHNFLDIRTVTLSNK